MSRSRILDYVAQPDGLTCQAACIAKAIGTTDVIRVRRELLRLGTPGDPNVMAEYLRPKVASYRLDLNANLREVDTWIEHPNRIVITHGWFTNSGHVITLVNQRELNGKPYYVTDDPWGEFDFPLWSYTGNWNGDDMLYSRHGIYAACVAGNNVRDSHAIYRAGKLDSLLKNAWCHFIEN